MSNLTISIVVFVSILVIGGWISSEYISHKSAKKNKKYERQISKLEKENNTIQQNLTAETDRATKYKTELETLREAKDHIRTLEKEYRSLQKAQTRTQAGLELLKEKVTSKKYSSNSLAKEVIMHLNEHCPTNAQISEQKMEETRGRFKRIKNDINGEAG